MNQAQPTFPQALAQSEPENRENASQDERIAQLWNHAARAFWRYTADAADSDTKRFKGIL